jgi:lauroyl/myristoyl acyltransferase
VLCCLLQQRLADGSGYKLASHPPLDNFPGEQEEADCLRINQWSLKVCPSNTYGLIAALNMAPW